MPWDQDDKDWVEPELTREEILGHIKFCKSRQEVADYARCIAESHDDESLYYLILGTFEMMEESGCEEKFQDTIQKHKELLLSKIF